MRDSSNGQLCLACHHRPANGDRTEQSAAAVDRPASTPSRATRSRTRRCWAAIPTLGRMPASPATCRTIRCRAEAAARAGTDRHEHGSATQNCIACHNGGTNISPAIPNVYAEFAKIGHPFRPEPTRTIRNESGAAEQQPPRDLRGLPQPACFAAGDVIHFAAPPRFADRRMVSSASARRMASRC